MSNYIKYIYIIIIIQNIFTLDKYIYYVKGIITKVLNFLITKTTITIIIWWIIQVSIMNNRNMLNSAKIGGGLLSNKRYNTKNII